MANGQRKKLPSSVGGKLDTGTTEVLVNEGASPCASLSSARPLQSSTRRASLPRTSASSSSQTTRALRVSSVASAESGTVLNTYYECATVITTFPFLCPPSTYLKASAICSNG
jgi:hypothetical protein